MFSMNRNVLNSNTMEVVDCLSFLQLQFQPVLSLLSGCLPMTQEPDWSLTLYTKQNPTTGIELNENLELDDSVNKTSPWIFIIHGFTTSPKVSPWFDAARDSYFEIGDHNIVYVDWSKLSGLPYSTAIINAEKFGKTLGKQIIKLNKLGVPWNKIRLLGYSLGGQTVGFVGKYIVGETGNRVGRITALDPAGPYFDIPTLNPPNKRICTDDADFVDVIHTDMGHYGITAAVGHVDFYVNGGAADQPGCDRKLDINASHERSTKYFVESIRSDKFVARKAATYEDYKAGKYLDDKKVIFGENVDHTARGSYYLQTNAEPPYAKGD